MLTAEDRSQMRQNNLEIIEDKTTSIVIRRAGSNLDAQAVRIVRASNASDPDGQNTDERSIQYLVIGPPELDIKLDDRFTAGGILYTVTFVRPDRVVRTVAEVEAKI